MVGEKGLEPSVADKIGEYVKLKGGMELAERLMADEALNKNKTAMAALEEMKLLLQYVDLFKVKDEVSCPVIILINRNKCLAIVLGQFQNMKNGQFFFNFQFIVPSLATDSSKKFQ